MCINVVYVCVFYLLFCFVPFDDCVLMFSFIMFVLQWVTSSMSQLAPLIASHFSVQLFITLTFVYGK